MFQWVSALTTCGFQTTELQPWDFGAKFLFSVAMIFGGTADSTVGVLKLRRVVTLYRAILWHFQQLFLQPQKLMQHKINNEVLTAAKAYRRVLRGCIRYIVDSFTCNRDFCIAAFCSTRIYTQRYYFRSRFCIR
ncbi:MAG: hypothetical protein KME55_20690 [Nostoc indistinguendum CM1-VF10]|nr:hypothetical protein [Nostoc indistinguendum CM1-VF10]